MTLARFALTTLARFALTAPLDARGVYHYYGSISMPVFTGVKSAQIGDPVVAIESSGQSKGNPRLYELIEHAPKTGKSPTVWAWPQLIDHLKVAGQPVQGPWPPHQERRPDPDADSLPVAIPDRGPRT